MAGHIVFIEIKSLYAIQYRFGRTGDWNFLVRTSAPLQPNSDNEGVKALGITYSSREEAESELALIEFDSAWSFEELETAAKKLRESGAAPHLFGGTEAPPPKRLYFRVVKLGAPEED